MQDVLERALSVLLRSESASLTVAGRTDSGVHALGQVASFAGPPVSVGALNALLPDDVAVLSCTAAADCFDARADATSRAYIYLLLTRPGRSALHRSRALHWPRAVDRAALDTCATALVGTHDFTAFTPTETTHVRFSRDVSAAFWRESPDGEHLQFWIEADSFVRHMNRILVGTMLEVASGRRTVSSFCELLEGRARSEAGKTAPACGLYLVGVGYGGERVLGFG